MAVGDSYRNAQVRVGDPLGKSYKLAYLTADNTNIDCTGISFLELASDNATATSRTFTLTASNLRGHELFIVFTTATNKAELLSSGNVKLTNGTWTATQYTTMHLVSDGTYWYELSRGLNTWQTTSSVTLSADNQAVVTSGNGTILLTSDNATATSRTFTLGAGSAGQMTTLVLLSATNKCELLIDSTTFLTRSWYPRQYDTLSLISDGTNWYEISRTFGGAAGTTSTVALTADDQAVATAGITTLLITSDNATAANRTFVLAASPVVGHELTIIWGSANEGQIADTATVVTVGAWEPTNLYQTIKLVSDGTRWIELCRADPT